MLRCSSLSLSLSQKAYAATSRTRCTSIRDQYSHAPIVPLLKKSNFSPSINTSCILLWNLKISRCYSTSKGEESVGLGDPLRRKSERPNFEPPQISDQANEKVCCIQRVTTDLRPICASRMRRNQQKKNLKKAIKYLWQPVLT